LLAASLTIPRNGKQGGRSGESATKTHLAPPVRFGSVQQSELLLPPLLCGRSEGFVSALLFYWTLFQPTFGASIMLAHSPLGGKQWAPRVCVRLKRLETGSAGQESSVGRSRFYHLTLSALISGGGGGCDLRASICAT